MMLIWGSWKEICMSNFPFEHMTYMIDPILAQYNGLEMSQMVLKGVNWARVLKGVKNEHFWW